MKIKTLLILSLLPWILTACADVSADLDPSNPKDTKPVNAAIDEEKLISAGIEAPQDPRTLNDSTYAISANSRLLLRFGAFLSDANNVLDEQPILLRVQIPGTDVSVANKNLQVCPLLKNWMMYATWNRAHPYKSGNWDQPGGDIDFAECFSALEASDTALKNQEEKDFCSAKQAVCFNVLPYFKDFVRARNADNGMALINQGTEAISIFGKSMPQGPVLFWRKLKY